MPSHPPSTDSLRETAFVTGAASGIGLATARRLAEDGFSVVLVDRDPDALEQAAAQLVHSGHRATARAADVRDRPAVAAALDAEGRINVLVCAAGIGPMRAFDDISDEDFRQVLDVNLLGTFICCQEASRRMQPGGRIITVSSRAALGTGQFAHYVASKAGVVGLTRAMAIDLRHQRISVNSVAPGFTDTGMTRALTPEQHAAASALEPAGRPADPAEIANAIAFFASPSTSFVTGQTLFVDGGKSLGGLGA
ncbi:SDR family NAD(P)-dependent oxidoreductase [Delftia sp. WSY_14]|uniref:SDR family NAD(P)-dependent oxidoreductase n=1 Tax=unclassified Delftia TaxID=2613839 RepID=UPI00370CC754